METVKSVSPQTLQDFSLVDLALEGEQQAYRVLFKRYWKRLFFRVSKLVPDKEEARDITMEAFSKAFFNLHRFSKDYCFSTWLYTIATNHGLDFIKKKRLPTTPLILPVRIPARFSLGATTGIGSIKITRNRSSNGKRRLL